MNSKHFRWVFLAIAVALYFRDYSKTVTIGASLSWSNGEYYFAGGTEPRAIADAIGIIVAYAVFLYFPSPKFGKPMLSMFRRFVAFWFDFVLCMMAIAPLIGIVPTLIEWQRTGNFAWSFVRYTPTPYDGWTTGVLTVLAFIFLALYFALPLVFRKPSPGTCIMGYQIVADDGNPLPIRQALSRTAYGFRAVCTGFLGPFASRNSENGKFWLDERFATHAVKLD